MQGEAQSEEQEAGAAGSPGPDAGRWHAAGDLHLRNDEGGEGDVRCQGRAVGVDKGFDLLGFFIAGLNLGEENHSLNIKPQNPWKGQVKFHIYSNTGMCFHFVFFLAKVAFNYGLDSLHK